MAATVESRSSEPYLDVTPSALELVNTGVKSLQNQYQYHPHHLTASSP